VQFRTTFGLDREYPWNAEISTSGKWH